MATSPMPDVDSDSLPAAPVDEEERWLDALEKGELDDNGELKKEIDESLLTARQVRHSTAATHTGSRECLPGRGGRTLGRKVLGSNPEYLYLPGQPLPAR